MPQDLSSQLDKVARAKRSYEQAGKKRDDAIRAAAAAGAPLRTIAKRADLSHQRVHQIVQGP